MYTILKEKTMTDKLLETTKILSGYVYHNQKTKLPPGIRLLYKEEDLGNGFYAEAYLFEGKIIIVYRGTDINRGVNEGRKDWSNNIKLIRAMKPSQLKNAESFYLKVRKTYPKNQICICGHSLGGSLAQIIGASFRGLKAFTFNAFGTGTLFNHKNRPLYPENVVNYGHEKDYVYMSNFYNHLGKSYIIWGNNGEKVSFTKHHAVESLDITKSDEFKPKHRTLRETIKVPLSNAEKLKARLESEWAQCSANKALAREKFTTNARILKNYVNEKTKSNRIYTEEEISTFSRKKLIQHSSAIEYQRKTIGIPGKKQVKEAVSCRGYGFCTCIRKSRRYQGRKLLSFTPCLVYLTKYSASLTFSAK